MIDWLYGLRHYGVKLGLDNIRGLLSALDHPERAFRCVHVAGTNGKGSVSAMIDSMLDAHGIRHGLFTSPHLVRPNERIRLDGEEIASTELDRHLQRIRTRIAAGLDRGTLEAHPSFFEVITATALLAFREHATEVAVLEVGLGGRLDATNVVSPDVCVITGIDLDHTKTLGGTLEHIATEKAGIIKPGRPLISGTVRQRAVDVIARRCREREAPLIHARLWCRLEADDRGTLRLRTPHRLYEDIRIGLAGRFQIDNARIAISALEHQLQALGRRPDPDAVRAGLARVRWGGRLQTIEGEGDRPELLLDAAHNPAGIAALVRHLRTQRLRPSVILFGATTGKPLDQMLHPLAPFSSQLVIATPAVERGIDGDEVADCARGRFEQVEIGGGAAEAYAMACEIAGPDGLVLIAGSLYLIGEILTLISGRPAPGPVAM